jgi:hypothetical protein
VHKLMGSKVLPEAHDLPEFNCWICGAKSTRGMEKWKWSGASFAGHKAICAMSNHVCESCVVVMSGKPPNTERMFSHLVEGDSWLRVNKGQKPAMRDFLRREKSTAWFAAIADSGQKHVIPWAPINAPGSAGRVMFEEILVELPDAAGWAMVDDISDMLTGGATKDELLPGAWSARAYSVLGPERIEAFEEQWGSKRGGSWFDLAVWLAQRDEEKVAERMAAEKAAAAEKKAKSKGAKSGNQQGRKGKASDGNSGGDPRPAKRVPANERVQCDEALGPNRRPATSGSEDQRDSGAVVHGDATRAPVVGPQQGQLGFVF